MNQMPKILAFAGSTRSGSFNKKILAIAAEAARKAGARVTVIDLRDFPMPLYDGDLETKEGLPESARRFRKLLLEHEGLLIASPEYNSSISAVLKNSIDWATRDESAKGTLECFTGKVAGLISASPGALGGLRGLVTLRSILSNINVIVIPEQTAVSKAHELFGEDGKLKDAKQQAALEKVGTALANLLSRLARAESTARAPTA